jgi:hypothetical protein
MVNMLAIGPKFCGFISGRGDELLTELKICSTASFGGEVKPSASCHYILWNIKITSKCDQI